MLYQLPECHRDGGGSWGPSLQHIGLGGRGAIAKPQCPDNQHTSNLWAVPAASVVSKFFLMNPKLRVLINWIEKIRGSERLLIPLPF